MSQPSGGPFSSLRSFIEYLDESGQLERVTAPVDKDWEIASIVRWAIESAQQDASYALLFENVVGSEIPVAVNLYGSPERYAAALGVGADRLLERWADALADPKPTISVDDAPVHEVIESERPDLLSLPSPTWTPERDAGPYLSAAKVITKDPDSGVQNLGSYRIQIHDSRRAGLFFGTSKQHGAMHLARYAARNESMPVAIVVGAPPAVGFAAAAKTAYGIDELEIAGGLAGTGVEVTKAITVDLDVPAHSECIIEGLVRPGAKADEGPFGEALGYMQGSAPAAVIDVTAITHRRDTIHHGYIQQLPPSEGHVVMEWGVLGPLWFYLTQQLKLEGIADLAILSGSGGLSMVVAQVSEGRKLAGASLGQALAKFNFGQKFIYLVDEDIEIRDPVAVNWALSTRVDPERDIQFVSDVLLYQADPSTLARLTQAEAEHASPPYRSSMAIVDATLKCDVPEIALPGSALMDKALSRWDELGLPPIAPRARLRKLLKANAQGGMTSPLARKRR